MNGANHLRFKVHGYPMANKKVQLSRKSRDNAESLEIDEIVYKTNYVLLKYPKDISKAKELVPVDDIGFMVVLDEK